MKPENPEKTTDLLQVTDKLYYIMFDVIYGIIELLYCILNLLVSSKLSFIAATTILYILATLL
jgi:hypothetical protein